MSETVLRKLELQVAHQPSFLFWDLKGAVAERWAHGPHFAAVADQGNQITLQSDADKDEREGHRVAIAGIMVSNFVWESPPRRSQAESLGLDFLGDCITAFKVTAVNRIVAREQWVVTLDHLEAAQGALEERFPELSSFVPSGYATPYSGISFNAGRTIAGGSRVLSVSVGIIRDGTAQQFFNLRDERDDVPNLGVFVDVVDANSGGFSSPENRLRDAASAVSRDAQHALSRARGMVTGSG